MTLSPGKKIGPYEIVAPLGAGGMGEVFRARDTRLGRDVAIKALPDDFSQDAERLSRFEREARLLASLNHPNIAGIHGLEEVDGVRYLVLEFVDGETLAARIARGPLSVDDAIEVCKEIASGLEAAHENGIIHRDLKPGNVIITPGGQAKVLDFGLATSGAGSATGSNPNLTHSPTVTHHATHAGVILGTAAYMSPEQARGKALDRRTDIWSFGCVLYECLTGKQLHDGETVSDLIARILEREPNWDALPANTPPRVRELLKRCLRKDPKERLRDVGDARLELLDAYAGGTAPSAAAAVPARSSRLPWMIAVGAGVLAVAALAFVFTRPAPRVEEKQPMHLSIPLPAGLEISLEVPDVVIAPDGLTVAFVATDSSGTSRIYLRALQSVSVRPVPGTEGARLPFWSPDGKNLAFFADGNLARMAVANTGRPQILAPAPAPRGGAWSPNDVIVFQPAATGPLMQLPASGGNPKPATVLDESRGETAHRFPQFLPDGKHFLYAALPGKDNNTDTCVGSLDAGSGTLILTSPNIATYATPGYLIFNSRESIVAQPFDAKTFTLSGSPQVIRDLYNTSFNYAGSPIIMTCRDGTLIQREFRTTGNRIVLMDRKGNVTTRLRLPDGRYGDVRFSPDGRHLAVAYGRIDESIQKVWVVDIARNVSTRLAFKGFWDVSPIWTSDGRYLIWGSDSDSGRNLMRKRADGSGEEELLADVPNLFNDPTSVTSNAVVYRSLSGGDTNEDLWILPLTGDGEPRPLLQTQFNEIDGAVSPDGHWIAYRSDESGRMELYVAAFPSMDRRVRVSTDGAAPNVNASLTAIRWRNDGRELLYIGGDGRTLMSVPVESGETFKAGIAKPLFRFARETTNADVSENGQVIAAIVPTSEETRSIINLVMNWTQELDSSK